MPPMVSGLPSSSLDVKWQDTHSPSALMRLMPILSAMLRASSVRGMFLNVEK